MSASSRVYNGRLAGEHLHRTAFPLGGIGSGMICLEGAGALSHFSLKHRPDVFNEPLVFSALHVEGENSAVARVLEGPVPPWKIMFPWGKVHSGAGGGGRDKAYGLPHFAHAAFEARFPFATVRLQDERVPLEVELAGWSPFLPGNADDSSLPVAALEYTFHNVSPKPVQAVYSFHARNIMHDGQFDKPSEGERPAWGTRLADGGFELFQDGLEQVPWAQGSFCATTDHPQAVANCRWFRGGWFDALTMVWKSVAEGDVIAQPPYEDGRPSPGGSLYVPLHLGPGETVTVRLRLAWYVPHSSLRIGRGPDDEPVAQETGCGCGCGLSAQAETYRPWYAGRFSSVSEVNAYWKSEYARLRASSQAFADCFYDTTLPPEVIEAVAANLTILKSPTILRQTDGRLWGWEGCCDDAGCCSGSCTHVWNYAQALPHLFPDLERSLRQTEFVENQDEHGHQNFRACLPVRPNTHGHHAAADGQLGGILKVYRDWRISGDTDWLRAIWPRVRISLDFCIRTWDPDREGMLKKPHHNTYDIEFWGPDGMCGSFYVGALKAVCRIGEALGEDVSGYADLCEKGRAYLDAELYDGEYFLQKIRWSDLNAPDPVKAAENQWNVNYSTEARELLQQEGPKYQYGAGCLADGVLGAWLAEVCGLGEVLDAQKVEGHLRAVYRYNFRDDLSEHANPQRPTYALGTEAGLLLCTWPKGGRLTLPFPYSDEVWTGIEYQVASHLMMFGRVEEALVIVRAVRDRYDGRVRNPFNEYECGHWYARAMSSYGLLQGLTGQRYDAVEKVLYLRPRVEGDWRSFLCTATGYGTVGMKGGEPFLEVRHGVIEIDRIEVQA